MFKPDSNAAAMPLLLLSLVCWGSWANVEKLCSRNFPFVSFYLCYSLSCFLTTVCLGLTFGNEALFASNAGDKEDFIKNFSSASYSHMFLGLASGVVFNVANVLLVIGIKLVGLSISFPVGIGLSLVLGTLLSYVISPSGTDEGLLFVGVALAFLAVCSMALSYHYKGKGAEEAVNVASEDHTQCHPKSQEAKYASLLEDAPSTSHEPAKQSFATVIVMLVSCGVLMGAWPPLATVAMKGDEGLNPYDHAFFFTLAASVTTVPIMYYLMKNPFDGTGPIAVTDLFTGEHGYSAFWASCGGFAWTLGTVVNLVSSSQVSEAVAYSIGQSAPMVAAGWGIFVFGEFKGAPMASWLCMIAMVVCYSGAIACIALSAS